MRISTAVHPTEYCRSAPSFNAFPRISVTFGLPCSPENEEVPYGARRIRAREILRLRSVNGLSQNAITRTAHVSKHSVQDVLEAARERGVSWEDVEGMSEETAYALLFPGRGDAGPMHADPDWARVHRELAKTGVTLKILRAEYADGCAEAGAPSMSYDRFCKRYWQYTVSRNAVGRLGHKASRNIEVDWSGPTKRLVGPATGEVRKVYLFVACLPFSRYSYVEPTLDMKQDTWLLCHVHAFSFLGGATPCIIPGKLRTGVAAHPRAGEPVLNAAYEELAAHNGSAVISARVRRPRDKPSAENEVSRREVFEEVERPLLRLLPAESHEVCEWVYGRKVQTNCYVAYARIYCSVSHLLVGSTVDLRVPEGEVEVFSGGERVATHLIVVDECLLDKPDTEFRSMLLELMELRYGTASTVFCTQFKKKDWHPRLGGGVHADAIMDRIVHNAVWADMGEANMRQRRG